MKTKRKRSTSNAQRSTLNAGKVEQFLERYVSRKTRAKNLYKSADAALDHALALAVSIDQPIEVRFRDKKNIITRKLVVKDLFKETNTVFKSVSGHRYEVADYKEPKPAKATAEATAE